jgi:hypothetical protein
MVKRSGRAILVLALLAAGCSRLHGGGDANNKAALSEVCGEASRPVAVRPVTAKPDPRPRVVDDASHISYLRGDAPWLDWQKAISPGRYGALFNAGFYQVTDPSTPIGEYDATILSGRVYAGQQQHPDVQCYAEQLAEDLHQGNYPTPNTRADVAAKPMTIDGHPAYLVRYRLGYHVSGYTADSELVTVVVIDTRQPDLAILYSSIPNNVSQYESLVDKVIASIRVA